MDRRLLAARRIVVPRTPLLFSIAGALAACSGGSPAPASDAAKAALSDGRWQDALDACSQSDPARSACDASWCELLAESMLFVHADLDDYLLPKYRTGDGFDPATADIGRLLAIEERMTRVSSHVDDVVAGGCRYTLDHMPMRIGDASDPIVDADVRGEWTPRSALLLGAAIDSVRYVFAAFGGTAPVPAPDSSGVPGLPDLMDHARSRLAAQEPLLWSEPADESAARGGWLDRDGDGKPSDGDELLVDLFVPGSDARVYDFSAAPLVRGETLTRGALATQLPKPACGYAKWHVGTLLESKDFGTTDGMSFSPDGARLAFPMRASGNYQVHVGASDATGAKCLTCGVPAWNDGVRWRPGTETLLFISNRDHPFAIGGAGGGAGQELYAMRSDGSQQTRLTTSHAWATNYHANWSADGARVVWGSTEARTWDVMLADFVDDAGGMRLANVRTLVHDTTWWETHGFTHDGKGVIVTNTRHGLLSPDIYAIDIATGARTRLTDDPAWDEHAHLSPDGTRMSWISARWRKAGALRFAGGEFSPVYDFFWIAPGIFFTFVDPPAGYSTELTLMSADGTGVTRLTTDDEVVADNEWSPDGKRIVFRQTSLRGDHSPRLRVLTFDDCP